LSDKPGAAGRMWRQAEAEIGGYGRRRQWKYRPSRPLRGHFRPGRINCLAFRKGPRNHIGASADGNPRHSPLFTVRRL